MVRASSPGVVSAGGPTDRALGCLLGLCVGGALGRAAALGAGSSGDAVEVEDALAWGPDTLEIPGPTAAIGAPAAFALATAESWVAHGLVVEPDLARRWCALAREGDLEAGAITRAALDAWSDGAPLDRAAAMASRLRPGRAGDGPLARALPLVLGVGGDRLLLRRAAYRSATVTHADPVAAFVTVAACLFGLDLLRLPVAEAGRRTVQAVCEDLPLRALDALRPAPPQEPAPAGQDAVGVLAAAITLLARFERFETVVVDAANRGGGLTGSASAGALAGGLAGLRDGAEAIPRRWVEALTPDLRARCARLAETLPQAAGGVAALPEAPEAAVPAAPRGAGDGAAVRAPEPG